MPKLGPRTLYRYTRGFKTTAVRLKIAAPSRSGVTTQERHPAMQSSDIAIPTLPSRSLPATLRFYEALGFAGKLVGAGGVYAILSRGDLELHFFSHPELRPAESHAGCYIRLADVDAVYQSFQSARLPSRGIPRMDELEDKPWGLREFAVVDEDGNQLRIGQVL
jgi:catechol 2,3-dioxygenase-like lactoylglutathione lyase family enzyme